MDETVFIARPDAGDAAGHRRAPAGGARRGDRRGAGRHGRAGLPAAHRAAGPAAPAAWPGGPMPWAVLAPLTVCGSAWGRCSAAPRWRRSRSPTRREPRRWPAAARDLGARQPGVRGWSPARAPAGRQRGAVPVGAAGAGAADGAAAVRARASWCSAVVLFLAGFAISPTLIASVAWIEEIVPADRITEGITVFTTGLGAGVAPGAALVGVVVDASGASASYWVPAVAGLLGARAWPSGVRPPRAAPAGERNHRPPDRPRERGPGRARPGPARSPGGRAAAACAAPTRAAAPPRTRPGRRTAPGPAAGSGGLSSRKRAVVPARRACCELGAVPAQLRAQLGLGARRVDARPRASATRAVSAT